MSKATLPADQIRDKIEEQEGDLDDEEWELILDDYEEKVGDHGDRDFVAWAAAYMEFGIQIESDFSLPGGGNDDNSDYGIPDDGVDHYDLADLDEVDYEGEEQIEITGWVMSQRDDVSSNNNPQKKFTLRDETGSALVMGTGDSIIESIQSAGLETGDYVRFRGAQVFRGTDDDGNYTDFYAGTLPPWTEIETPEPKQSLRDAAKRFPVDMINEGDFVAVEGLVTDVNFNEYTGCAECMTKYDPDENRVCPKCGASEMQDYEPGSMQVTASGESVTVSFSPSDSWPTQEIFEDVRVFGEWEIDEYEGTEYEQIGVVFAETVEEVEEIEDTDDDPDTEMHEAIEDVEEKVVGFGHTMPAQAGIKILQSSHGIDDQERQIELMEQLYESDRVEVVEDQGTLADADWASVKLEAVE